MRSVRCDACGTKALLAASQCPKCGHLFDVRNGFGELQPLAYCSMCDSYYPESLGACRWCGTKPEAAPIAPRVWKGVGVAALVVLVATTWLLRGAHPKYTGDVRKNAQRRLDSAYKRSDADTSVAAIAPADTLTPRMTTVSAGTLDRDSVTPAAPPSVVSPPSPLTAPTPQPAASPGLEKPTTGAPAPSAKSRPSSRWVMSVTKSWVVVRAGPSKGSKIVASVGPNSRVQLGESNGTWRRIKTPVIAGWVEPGSLIVAVPTSPKPRTFVAR